jgi:hypothetical protein
LGPQSPRTNDRPEGGEDNDMHPEELMKPDLLSEIVLLTFGTLIISSLAVFVVAVLARS